MVQIITDSSCLYTPEEAKKAGFFAIPLCMTIYWSFNEVTSVAGGLTIKWIGMENYINLFKTQMLGTKTFLEVLTNSILEMLINVPVIFICFFELIKNSSISIFEISFYIFI